ncbi:hypothetical protein [Actinomadura sp. WMMA1423]|uniref:hypothetical protein n=1 Tax=Actinomadura sp. WMMA1423 TaxID=2591108 RepID=UPI001146C762|nr:hypothetical protein [Actinomadura sp. WMMA1423]
MTSMTRGGWITVPGWAAIAWSIVRVWVRDRSARPGGMECSAAARAATSSNSAGEITSRVAGTGWAVVMVIGFPSSEKLCGWVKEIPPFTSLVGRSILLRFPRFASYCFAGEVRGTWS